MRLRNRIPGILVLAGALAMAASAAHAQLSPACNFSCPPGVGPCTAREAACQSLLTGYKAYLGQLGAGASTNALPDVYKQALAGHYTSSALSSWRFAFGSRQPSNNATTDCTTTYFNSDSYVTKLARGDLKDGQDDVKWFLHELRHAEQCAQVGGRDFFAKLWFDHLIVSVSQNATNPATVNYGSLHDRMPMEGDAASKASATYSALKNCCIDRDGRLRPKLSVDDIAADLSSVSQFTRVALTAKTTAGWDGLQFEWRVNPPGGTSSFLTFSSRNEGTAADSAQAVWIPRKAGQYQIRVRVNHPGTSVLSVEHTRSFSVAPMPLQIDSTPLLLPTNPLRAGTRVRLTARPGASSADLTYLWEIKPPGASDFRTFAAAQEGVASAGTVDWTPRLVGSYQVKAIAMDGNAPVAEQTVTITTREKLLVEGGGQREMAQPSVGAIGLAAGGSPFTRDCPDGVLVGLRVRTGAHVDSLRAVCARIKPGGARLAISDSQPVGGTGGNPADLLCDDGWAITAMYGKAGAVVESIGIRCGKLTPQPTAAGSYAVSGSTSRGPVGSGGGNAFEKACPGGQVAIGLSGRSGTLVDQISSLSCRMPR